MPAKQITFKIYLITDRKLCKKPFLEAIEESCRAGIKAIHLREKDLSTKELLDMAFKIREITAKYKTLLFINDRIDICLAVNADGIQLTENSLPIAVAKKITQKLIIGASRHTLESCIEAEKQGADFIVFGSIFKEKNNIKPQGIEILKKVCTKIKIHVFAVGGINPENAKSCILSGASGVAVISYILSSENIEEKVYSIQQAVLSHIFSS